MGLVNEVVPRAELDAAVDRWLDDILACAPLSVRAIKQVVRRTAHLTAAEAQAQRLPALVEALQSEDSQRGRARLRREAQARLEGTLTRCERHRGPSLTGRARQDGDLGVGCRFCYHGDSRRWPWDRCWSGSSRTT